MNKHAQLTVGSPCEYCGLPSTTTVGNVPVCPRHHQLAQNAAQDNKMAHYHPPRIDEIDDAARTLGG